MISIVLVEPEIPENTGNISRTCACTGMPLFLVGEGAATRLLYSLVLALRSAPAWTIGIN